MGEIVPDADGSCKITEARSPTDPEHEEQEENHSRAHRDRTAGTRVTGVTDRGPQEQPERKDTEGSGRAGKSDCRCLG